MTSANDHDREMAAVRDRNTGACVKALRARGVATPGELVTATRLSRPTVESILLNLSGLGVVSLDESASPTKAGRPARRFVFEAGAAYVVGIDLGLDAARALLSDLTGSILASVERSIDPGTDGFGRLDLVSALVEQLCGVAEINVTAVRSVVVAVTGIVDRQGRMTLSDLVPEWNGVDLAARLSQQLSCAVGVENDVKVAAVAEHHAGTARLVDDVVFVKVDRFVSAAIVIGGRLHSGRRSAAGEIGRLESAGREIELPSDRDLLDERIELVARADANDQVAEQQLTDYTRRLARSVGLVALTVDPDLVVIGGHVSEIGDPLLRRVRAQLAELAGRAELPTMALSALGGRAVSIGALVRALDLVAHPLYGVDVDAPQISVPDRPTLPVREAIDDITVHSATTRPGIGAGRSSKVS